MDHDRASSHIGVKSSLSIVFCGNVAAGALGALALWLVSRQLTVAGFGLFSLALAVIRSVPVLTTLGLDTTTMRFASSYLKDGKGEEAVQAIRAMFAGRSLSAVLLTAALIVFARPIAERIFRMPPLTPLLRLAAIGVLGASQFNYLKSVLWSYQDFRQAAILQVLFDSTKLISVLALAWAAALTPTTATAVWALASFPVLLRAAGRQKSRFFTSQRPAPALVRQLFNFTKWIFVSELCRASLSCADLFIVAALLGKETAGIYGLATNLTYLFPVFFISLKAVLVPHVSRFRSPGEFKNYLRRALRFSVFMGSSALIGVFLCGPLIPKVFGARYAATVPIFNLLFLAHCVNTVQMPFFAVFYSLHRPRLLAIIDTGRVIAVVLGTYFSIPALGALAPACALLATNLASAVLLGSMSQRLVRRRSS
jgi:O-antigen/teichoic acid export membrane protein